MPFPTERKVKKFRKNGSEDELESKINENPSNFEA
jgi:hypothetical protein